MGNELGHNDEFFHPGAGEPRFAEWMDFNFYDISSRLGGFFRLHHHPTHGFNEMTVCLYLADGRSAFRSERTGLGADTELVGGGLRVEVIRPFEELNVSYDGKLLLLEDPYALVHPERAYADNPQVDTTVRLTFSGRSTLYEDSGDRSVARDASIARHYEQLSAAMGSVRVDDASFDVDGLGLRGHRWGIRSSTPASYRRRLTANVGPSFGFMGFDQGEANGARRRGGFVWDGTAFHVCDHLSINTSWTGAESVHHGIDLTLRDGDQAWHARGTVVSLVVRRHEEGEDVGNASTGRLTEGVTEWRLDDGQIGYGMSEYFDWIVDGKPTSLPE
jgi:hypothetical protein